jgi:hypothetical protein
MLEWMGNRQPWEIPAQEYVDRYLAAIPDPDQRLAYLQALDRKMRSVDAQDWVQAIAVWRLRQQTKE